MVCQTWPSSVYCTAPCAVSTPMTAIPAVAPACSVSPPTSDEINVPVFATPVTLRARNDCGAVGVSVGAVWTWTTKVVSTLLPVESVASTTIFATPV